MTTIEEIEVAIQEHKLELLNPSREYTQGEIIYHKGYIEGLETALETLIENNRKVNFSLN
jgi:hypothetical protein